MEEPRETLCQYLARHKEYTALGIVLILELISIFLRWRIYGKWTTSSFDVMLCAFCAEILLLPEKEKKPTKKKRSIKPKTWYGRVANICLIGVMLALGGWVLSDEPYNVGIWGEVAAILGGGICLLFPRYEDQSKDGQKREVARLLSIAMGSFLLATTLFFMVARPLTIHQAERLAHGKSGKHITYGYTKTPKDDLYYINQEDNPTELEQETGYYLFTTKGFGEEIRVYFATGKVVIV